MNERTSLCVSYENFFFQHSISEIDFNCLRIYSSTLTCQIIVQQILLFFWEKNTYTTLFGPTRLLIFEIFPSKADFHLHK